MHIANVFKIIKLYNVPVLGEIIWGKSKGGLEFFCALGRPRLATL